MSLDVILEELAREQGAGFYGVADLSPARQAIMDQGGPIVAAYPRAVSIGIALSHALVDQLPNGADPAAALNYGHHGYSVINLRLDHIVSRVANLLQQEGYRSFPVPAAQTVNSERHLSIFSNKMAARLAGLGWIGKSCLLVTPAAGPRVRWATCLTNAPLAPTGSMLEERCGSCNDCVDICPVKAFTGKAFREEEPREARYAPEKCKQHQDELKERIGVGLCGLCLYVCPYGRKAGEELA